MNKPATTFLIFLCICLLTLLSACKGPNTAKNQSGTQVNELETVAVGDTLPGITDKKILVVFQDKSENYWFAGGDGGAYKYDGKNLVLFTTKDGLCSNAIISIQEDQQGNIYFDTHEGVSKFDGQKFTTLSVIDDRTAPNEWKLEANDLWFRMGWNNSGPYRYDGKFLYQLTFPKTARAAEFHAKYPNASYNPYGIYTIYTDRQGHVWFGTASLGVCRYDGKSISWLYERQLTETPGGGDFGIRSIIEDQEGYFWFCNTRYRYQILPDSTGSKETNQINYRKEAGIGTSTNDEENDFPYFLSVVKDKQGDLWMVTYDEGVWRNNGKELIHYPIKDGANDVLLFFIYQDQQGVLWLGTHNAGVYKFTGETFEKFNS